MIPLNIFQNWHTKNLPPIMKQVVDEIKSANPEFKHYLYDLDDCREFIKSHFEYALNSFDKLKPIAYKSDLWRLCVLYKYGGIYLDVKFKPMNNFKFIDVIDNEYFCRDMHPQPTVYNAFIISKPGNNIIYKCIQQIIENTETNYYGRGSLDPTGPVLIASKLSEEQLNNLGIFRLYNDIYLLYNDKIVLLRYPEYRDEQSKYQLTKHYDEMWRNKDIYNII